MRAKTKQELEDIQEYLLFLGANQGFISAMIDFLKFSHEQCVMCDKLTKENKNLKLELEKHKADAQL